jgi:Beta-propeller repeat
MRSILIYKVKRLMKKTFYIIILLLTTLQKPILAQVGINSTGAAPQTSAMLDVSSSNKGFLPPRMTTAQRLAIDLPASGLIVFDTNVQQLYIFSNNTWNIISSPTYPRLSSDAIDALSSPQIGDLAYDLTFKCLKHFNGTKWACVYQDPNNLKPDMMAWNIAGTGFTSAGNSVITDALGNVYVTGLFSETVTFGTTTITSSGSMDIFIAKYNNTGVLQWVKKAGGTGADNSLSIKLDSSGNIYITGFFENTATFDLTTITSSGTSDIFVAKYDNTGSLQWVQKAGGTSFDYSFSLAVDGSGSVYVTGEFIGNATFGTSTITSTGGHDIFIAKYNSSGILQFVQKAGGGGFDYGSSIALDNSGNIYITGAFNSTATFGTYTLATYGGNDIFIAKCNNSGVFQWVQKVGGTGSDTGTALAVDGSGNVYFTGYFQGMINIGTTSLTSVGSIDFLISKYNTFGYFEWIKNNNGQGTGITLDAVGNVYVTGNFTGTTTFGNSTLNAIGENDIFITKYNNSGLQSWVQRAGGPYGDFPKSITTDVQGNVYVTGNYFGTATFGTTIFTSTVNNYNIFVARLKD